MITNISLTTVFCTDLDETRDFYVDVLGFEPGDDITFGDYRWVTVKHPNQPGLSVHLTTTAHRSTTTWPTPSAVPWPPGR